MQTGITTAVLAGANSPDGQVREGEDAARYEGPDGAIVQRVDNGSQSAVIRQQPDPGPQSSLPAARRGRGQRSGRRYQRSGRRYQRSGRR